MVFRVLGKLGREFMITENVQRNGSTEIAEIRLPTPPAPIRYDDYVPVFKCGNCNKEGGIPLICNGCNIWICSLCWMSHDVEMMKKNMMQNDIEAYKMYFPNG